MTRIKKTRNPLRALDSSALASIQGGTLTDNTSRDTRLDVSRRYGGGGGGGGTDQPYNKEPTDF